MALARRARPRQGRLVIAVLHDLTMAARFCERLLLLSEGRLIADGPPDAVLTAERLAGAYGVRAWNGEAEGHRLVVPIERIALSPTALRDAARRR